jgi:glutathione S-transferase
MGLTLVSFALCPFLQRARTLLSEKAVPHEVRLIELTKRPEWFGPLSPRGKVPLLVTMSGPIDEPRAILEYLEEAYPSPALWPADPYLKAKDRALLAYAEEEIFPSAYRLQIAPDEDRTKNAQDAVREKLKPIERWLDDRPYLSGEGRSFGMADLGLLPFAARSELMQKRGLIDITQDLPNLRAWHARVLQRPSVHASLPEDFGDRVLADMDKRGAWLLTNVSEGG